MTSLFYEKDSVLSKEQNREKRPEEGLKRDLTT